MELREIKGKLCLETEYRTGNRAWAAKIIGKSDKYNFERIFLNGTRKGLKLTEVEEGDIIEEVIMSHTGRSRNSSYYEIKNGELSIISEREVLEKFI